MEIAVLLHFQVMFLRDQADTNISDDLVSQSAVFAAGGDRHCLLLFLFNTSTRLTFSYGFARYYLLLLLLQQLNQLHFLYFGGGLR